MLESDTGRLPTFVTVNDWLAQAPPWVTLGNAAEVGAIESPFGGPEHTPSDFGGASTRLMGLPRAPAWAAASGAARPRSADNATHNAKLAFAKASGPRIFVDMIDCSPYPPRRPKAIAPAAPLKL